MIRTNFLIVTLICSILLFTIHSYALRHFLYFHLWGFDSIVHVLGGFTLGLLVLIPFVYGSSSQKSWYLISVLGALIFSLVWEIFEYKIGMTFVSPKHFRLYVYDTIIDVVCGTLGGLIAGFVSALLLQKHKI